MIETGIERFVATLDPVALATWSRRFQRLAREGGAYVLLSDGVELAIPPMLTPVVIDEPYRIALHRDARLLVSAVARIARMLIEGPRDTRRALVFAPLSDFERDTMEHTYRHAEHLATARVDFLVGTDNEARALEINATIPAMQGYADAVASAYLRALGELRGVSAEIVDAAIEANGRNSDDLLESLLANHRQAGGRSDGPQRIAIVSRAGDSQGGELDHYVRRWTDRGHLPMRVTPNDITLEAGRATIDGVVPDIVYRHVFLRRVEPQSDFARMVLDSPMHHLWNPPASQLELKAVLAVASELARGDDSALTHEERAAINRRIPWTRLLTDGATTGIDGSALSDLLGFTHAHPSHFVLKRSWDYGGRGVFLGAELHEESSQHRLQELLGPRERPYTWSELVTHATKPGESWVVQHLVDVKPRAMLAIEPTGPREKILYADLSAFVSLGNDAIVSGGAVRTSGGRIVNIQGGGGLAPLLRAEAVQLLLDA